MKMTMPLPFPVPISVRGRLDVGLELTFRTQAESVERLCPRGLLLRTHRGFAFWNVFVTRVSDGRHGLAPARFGVAANVVAYRLLVETDAPRAERTAGLYPVRADADSCGLTVPGLLLTPIPFNGAVIDMTETDERVTATVRNRDGRGNADLTARDARAGMLAFNSPFDSLGDAKAFLEPGVRTLAPNRSASRVRTIVCERDDRHWRRSPMAVERGFFAFFHQIGQRGVQLELAQRIEPIDCCWRLGRSTPLAGGELGKPDEAAAPDSAPAPVGARQAA